MKFPRNSNFQFAPRETFRPNGRAEGADVVEVSEEMSVLEVGGAAGHHEPNKEVQVYSPPLLPGIRARNDHMPKQRAQNEIQFNLNIQFFFAFQIPGNEITAIDTYTKKRPERWHLATPRHSHDQRIYGLLRQEMKVRTLSHNEPWKHDSTSRPSSIDLKSIREDSGLFKIRLSNGRNKTT